MVNAMTQVTVRIKRDRPGWFVELVELGLYAHGQTKQEAVEKLAEVVLDYWFHLMEDAALRRTEPCRQHYQFYRKQLWPAVLEALQRPPRASFKEISLLPLIAYRSAFLWLRGAGSPKKSVRSSSS